MPDEPELKLLFLPLGAPTDEDVERVAARIAHGLIRLGQQRGWPSEELDSAEDLDSALPDLYGASVRHRVATGRRSGKRVRRLGDRVDPEQLTGSAYVPRCATVDGVNLHANVAVPAGDRQRLERLCRYAARPPLANERLSRNEDGSIRYELRHPWHDGTTHVVFEPLELVEKLAALVPPPRFNLIRYHGILAPAAMGRGEVVPRADDLPSPDSRAAERDSRPRSDRTLRRGGKSSRGRNYTWAELLRRVFAVDILACPDCGGRMRILVAIHPPGATRAILEHCGLPARSPPLAAPAVDFCC